MYLFTVFLHFLISTVFSYEYSKEKCCKPDEYLQKNNTSYECTKDITRRLGIISNGTDFIERDREGECIEALNSNFSVFQISGGTIIKQEILNEKYFPKCCPLTYYYNTVLHSCVKAPNLTHDYIRDTFVKVGLPTCKLIVDHKLRKDIDIYESVIDIGRDGEYCIDENEGGDFTLRQCREDTEVCNHTRCIKKCCPDGQSFVNGAKCVDTYTNGLNLSFSSRIEEPGEPFAVISNRTCRIYIMNEKRYIFKLARNGTFSYWYNHTNSFIFEDIDNKYSYCIEHSQSAKGRGFLFFKCFEDKEYKQKFKYTLVPKILSCVFLGLTVIIYVILNEIRTLFGKILMNYCVATLSLFSLLVYAHVDLTPKDIDCKLIAYSLIFLSTVSFAWLNIMCCDIWWTFGSTNKQSIGIHQRKKNLKRLLWYLLYGWGMPTCLTLIIFLFSSNPVLPYSIHPYVGASVCFIENRPGNYASILFVRLPHLVIQIVNTVLFFRTILYCLRIKNEINRINDTSKYEKKYNFKRDRERLSLILKLSVIMGITFVFDVMSSFFEMSKMGTFAKYVEIIWDCINCLQGVFIFIIFICKKKVYYDFLRKLRISKDTPTISNGRQSVTSTTRMSVTNSNRLDNNRTSIKYYSAK